MGCCAPKANTFVLVGCNLIRGFCCLIFLKCSQLRMFTDDPVSIINWTGTSATLTVVSGVFFEGIIV